MLGFVVSPEDKNYALDYIFMHHACYYASL